jgi:hypothetical protein
MLKALLCPDKGEGPCAACAAYIARGDGRKTEANRLRVSSKNDVRWANTTKEEMKSIKESRSVKGKEVWQKKPEAEKAEQIVQLREVTILMLPTLLILLTLLIILIIRTSIAPITLITCQVLPFCQPQQPYEPFYLIPRTLLIHRQTTTGRTTFVLWWGLRAGLR